MTEQERARLAGALEPLRVARTHRAEGNTTAARAECERIRDDAGYLPHHRAEAGEMIREMDRTSRGLPARDPAASRCVVPRVAKIAAELWVAPDGNDANPGTGDRPFATLGRARDAVRDLPAAANQGARVVWVRAGEYPLRESFALTAADSGTEASPIVYRAVEKGTAVVRGGIRISGFTKVSDPAVLDRLPSASRDKVVQCDLKRMGITDYGKLQARGFGVAMATVPTLELYFNGEPMILSRWPNEGFAKVAKLVDGGSKLANRPVVFEYEGDRTARWTQARDAWMFGYWRACWADGTLAVGAVDPGQRRIATTGPLGGVEGLDPNRGIEYYAFNLLEELDAPGEWYLDRAAGVLYFYPPSDPAVATVELSMLSVPLVTMETVSHVRFEGLVFELVRHDGIVVRGGEHCLIAGCTIRRLAGGGVSIDGGKGHAVVGCDIAVMGRYGIQVAGGDRRTLEPCGHVVENCHIHDFSRIDRTYTPAVTAGGVGIRIAHNLIHHSPCHGMRIEGNDHLVEFNELHSLVYESDDQGAIDMFGNPTYRGVVFRHNYIHHIGNGGAQQAGIRLDDAISGMLVYGNVFYRCSYGNLGAVQMNSGRENIVDNNAMADCQQGMSGGWTPGWSENNAFWQMLVEGKSPDWTEFIMSDLYLSRYPLLAELRGQPPVNFLWRNVLWNCGKVFTGTPACADLRDMVAYEDKNPGFADPGRGDFRLLRDSPLFARVGFCRIPVEEMGLYADEFRSSWPVTSQARDVPDWRRTAEVGSV